MMRRVIVLLLVVGVLFGGGRGLWAQNVARSTNVPEGETVNGPYFVANETVTISGTVQGDVYIAGGTLLIDGTVDGSVWSAAGTMNIGGTVTGNVTNIDGELTTSGSVGGSLNMAGGRMVLVRGGSVGGNLVVAAGDVTVNGVVDGGVYVASGNLLVGDRVGGNLEAITGRLVLASGADIGGDVFYRSNMEADIGQGAIIGGQVNREPLPEGADVGFNWRGVNWENLYETWMGIRVFNRIVAFLSFLLTGWFLLRFLPIYSNNIARTLREGLWASLGWGALIMIAAPVVFLILTVIVIGIPIALVLLALYLVTLYMAIIYASWTLGLAILGRERRYWALVLGLAIYSVLLLIPVIAWLTRLVFVLFGLGAIALGGWKMYQKWRGDELV